MEEVIDLQYKISKYQKDHKFKKLFAALMILDDFTDDCRLTVCSILYLSKQDM